MREIKFRVWDTLAKRFIYPDKGYQGHYVLSLNGKFHNLQNGSGGDECVVQQFTGEYDKNKKEIYEGDIVKYYRLLERERKIESFISFVRYEDAKFGFDLTGFNEMFYELGHELNIEVVGNIFENRKLLTENPELLK